MSGGTKLGCAVALLLTGCTGSEGKLAIRALPASPSMSVKPVSDRVAEARGHLVLNNVALALEGFRKAQRDEPGSTDALLGIATCYDRMGRFELSRRYYEMALALAPTDSTILNALAGSLDAQGRRAEAREVRSELAVRSMVAEQNAVSLAKPDVTKDVSVRLHATGSHSITVALPPAAPAARQPLTEPVATAQAKTFSGNASSASPAARQPLAEPIATAQVKPVTANAARADVAPIPETRAANSGPRLERMSLGEVALVTTAAPRWRGEVVRQTARSTTVRFVPIQSASREVSVRLLNAARRQGLAARTRMALNGKGWKSVSIGDAARVRQRSLILYSRSNAQAARRLAVELRLGLAREPRPGPLTVLLGSDAISIGRSKG